MTGVTDKRFRQEQAFRVPATSDSQSWRERAIRLRGEKSAHYWEAVSNSRRIARNIEQAFKVHNIDALVCPIRRRSYRCIEKKE